MLYFYMQNFNMRRIYSVFLMFIFIGCSSGKKPLQGQTDYQRNLNAFFKDATTSPLKDKDRKKFEGLDFFEFDSTYVVNAKILLTPEAEAFEMKTSTERVALYRKYAKLEFKLKDEDQHLFVYQDLESDDASYLFLPFLDETNGETTYGGGRYIESRIPEGDILIVDFNKAFNPYCAYNEKYSCPIVPRENYLRTEINAGVKAYKKD